MTTVLQIEPQFAEHEKVEPLSDAAHRLWVICACWCRKPENLRHNGFVPRTQLPAITKRRWSAKRLEALAHELVDATAGGVREHGLWEACQGGWRFHDWHKYYLSANEEAVRNARAEAGRKGASARWQNGPLPRGKPMAPMFLPYAKPMAPEVLPSGDSAIPSPTPPPSSLDISPDIQDLSGSSPDSSDPSLPEDLTGSARVDAMSSAVDRVFEFWRTATGHTAARLDRKRQARIRARLRERFTVEQLCAAIENAKNDPFLMGQNDTGRVYDGIETLLRDAAQVERLVALTEPVIKSAPIGRSIPVQRGGYSAVDKLKSQGGSS